MYLGGHPPVCSGFSCHHTCLCLHSRHSKIAHFNHLKPTVTQSQRSNSGDVYQVNNTKIIHVCEGILTSFSSIKRFALFKSLWIILLWCKKFIPFETSIETLSNPWSLKPPFCLCRKSYTLPPDMNSAVKRTCKWIMKFRLKWKIDACMPTRTCNYAQVWRSGACPNKLNHIFVTNFSVNTRKPSDSINSVLMSELRNSS